MQLKLAHNHGNLRMPHSRHGKKVLILGAGGKVGRLLARSWRQMPPDGFEPIFQHHTPGMAGFVHWQEGDLPSSLPRVCAVVSLWGVTPGSRRAFSENARLALLAGRIAQDLGADRLFIASSAAVYGDLTNERMHEHAPLAVPTNSYGKSKLAMEHAIAEWAEGAPLTVCILRLANVIGADSLFSALKSGRPVTLDRFAESTGPKRSYVTATDLGRSLQALVSCPASDVPPVLNVAGTHALAMADLAEAAGTRITWRPAPPDATEKVELDTARLGRFLGADLNESSTPASAIAALRALEAMP